MGRKKKNKFRVINPDVSKPSLRKSGQCPYCQSSDSRIDQEALGDTHLKRRYTCKLCTSEWTEIYDLNVINARVSDVVDNRVPPKPDLTKLEEVIEIPENTEGK